MRCKNLHGEIRARQESVNKRFKQFAVLTSTFRHSRFARICFSRYWKFNTRFYAIRIVSIWNRVWINILDLASNHIHSSPRGTSDRLSLTCYQLFIPENARTNFFRVVSEHRRRQNLEKILNFVSIPKWRSLPFRPRNHSWVHDYFDKNQIVCASLPYGTFIRLRTGQLPV